MELFGSHKVTCQGAEIDFTPPWKRLTLKEAAAQYGAIDKNDLADRDKAFAHAKRLGIDLTGSGALGEIVTEIFEQVAEDKLVQPTFITHYPVEVSPMARKNEQDPTVTDRFELYITGREIANAFSELNDPEESAPSLCGAGAGKTESRGADYRDR